MSNAGPQPAGSIELDGSFIGTGLTVTPTGATTCTVEAPTGNVTGFNCMIGDLGLGAQTNLSIGVSSSDAGAVTVAATAAATTELPIDPNIADNSAQEAVGIADSLSNGAVQFLGNAQILAMARGDINGDGFNDLILGTPAGTPVQFFVSDGFRGFGAAIAGPDNSAQQGIALADFDSNGTLDMAIASAGVPDTVYANDGDGNFTLMATLPGPVRSQQSATTFRSATLIATATWTSCSLPVAPTRCTSATALADSH